MQLDVHRYSPEFWAEVPASIKEFGLHFADAEEEYGMRNDNPYCNTYYLARQPLTRRQLAYLLVLEWDGLPATPKRGLTQAEVDKLLLARSPVGKRLKKVGIEGLTRRELASYLDWLNNQESSEFCKVVSTDDTKGNSTLPPTGAKESQRKGETAGLSFQPSEERTGLEAEKDRVFHELHNLPGRGDPIVYLPKELKVMSVECHHRRFFGELWIELTAALKEFGLHLGDAEKEYGRCNPGSEYHTYYLARQTLTRQQLARLLHLEWDGLNEKPKLVLTQTEANDLRAERSPVEVRIKAVGIEGLTRKELVLYREWQFKENNYDWTMGVPPNDLTTRNS
jgi:hypothetical protein